MVLESPFYGARRPAGQEGSRLLHVSDLLVLGRATIEESLCLLEWSHRQGYGKLGEDSVQICDRPEARAPWLAFTLPLSA